MLKVYNTLSRKKEVFRPRKKKKINLFVCGPTVYDFSHIGHARTYIAFDLIVKYLREKGYDVFYLQNITDIDDKIIAIAKKEKVSWRGLARKYEREYLRDMKSLKVDSVTKYARATEHIKEILSQVKRLLKKEYAYQIKDGIYYDISKFKDYGKLSRRTILQAEDAITRIDESKGKKNKGDFCLWKKSRPGEPKWPSPWGYGRPGWHIEDTAIAEKYFGVQYDAHGGAKDLIFPHHEAEIAQMEGLSGKKPMVRYWLHTGFLTVKGQKMAKSLGNFITVRDFLKKPLTQGRGEGARVFRFFVLKSHYRSPINYTEKAIAQTKKELERIDEFVEKIKGQNFKVTTKIQNSKIIKNLVLRTQKEFAKAMDDDFNTPKAKACLFQLVNRGNQLLDKGRITPAGAKEILGFLKKIDKVFGFIFLKKPRRGIPEKVLKLVKEREKYRKEKEWKKADEIRKKIQNLGYRVEDREKGPKLKLIRN